jgi:hypothetical protein
MYERNRVVHGLWIPFRDGGTVRHISPNKLIPDYGANRAAALEKLADEACAIRAGMERVFTGDFPR